MYIQSLETNFLFQKNLFCVKISASFFSWKQGPFEGILGFSQGAGLASVILSLQSCSRKTNIILSDNNDKSTSVTSQYHFKFAIFVGGSVPRAKEQSELVLRNASYDIPSLHIIGNIIIDVAEGFWIVDFNYCHILFVYYTKKSSYLQIFISFILLSYYTVAFIWNPLFFNIFVFNLFFIDIRRWWPDSDPAKKSHTGFTIWHCPADCVIINNIN